MIFSGGVEISGNNLLGAYFQVAMPLFAILCVVFAVWHARASRVDKSFLLQQKPPVIDGFTSEERASIITTAAARGLIPRWELLQGETEGSLYVILRSIDDRTVLAVIATDGLSVWKWQDTVDGVTLFSALQWNAPFSEVAAWLTSQSRQEGRVAR